MGRIISTIVLLGLFIQGLAQMTPISRTITIGSMTYTIGIVLPSSYTDSTSKKYPSIMMLHGTGEYQTNPATIYTQGPIERILNDGWSGTQMLNGTKYEFINYALQQSTGGQTSSTDMIRIYDTLYTWYRMDTCRQYIAGLSAGVGTFLRTAAYSSTASLDRKMLLWTAAIQFSSGTSHSGAVLDSLARWTRRGGSIHYAIGEDDHLPASGAGRYSASQIATPAEAGRVGSSITYDWTNPPYSTTGHGGWPYGFDSSTIHPMGYNLYEYALMSTKTPYASAGQTTINVTLPTSTATLNGISREYAIGYNGKDLTKAWTKVSGPSVTITSPSNDTTGITGLSEGTYVFRFTTSAAGGLTATKDVTVNVSDATGPPTADAGTDQSITANNATLTGSGTPDGSETITGYAWVKMSGPYSKITSPTSASTTLTGLTAGVYVLRLITTQSDGQTDYDEVTITVTAAGAEGVLLNVNKLSKPSVH